MSRFLQNEAFMCRSFIRFGLLNPMKLEYSVNEAGHTVSPTNRHQSAGERPAAGTTGQQKTDGELFLLT